jgi:four helix bundle protein
MKPMPPMNAWEASVDERDRADPLWRMQSYRLSLYAFELGWKDVQALDRTRVTRHIAPQLYEALGSIGANVAEGYSRNSGLDRARFFEYGLGSTRESVVWYRGARPVLGPALVEDRIETLTRIRQLLLVTIPRERSRRLRRGDD